MARKKKVVKTKAKKRGVKPGTKRGPYKKNKLLNKNEIVQNALKATGSHYTDLFDIPNAKIGETLRIKFPKEWRDLQDKATIDKDYKVIAPTNAITLCGQLEEAISNLEIRISNSIAKINSLM